jgi:predicted  nucleic acid-binding Zn-ribbon protein
MTREADRTRELHGVTQLALRAVQTEMAALKSKEAGLRQNLQALTAQKTQQANQQRAADDPAMIARADLRWQHWVDQRRAAINAELAQVLALNADCQQRLQHVFGRDQAARALVTRAQSDVKQRCLRSASYES